MEAIEYFLMIVVLLLVVSVGSAQLSSDNYNISSEVVTSGGASVDSSNYSSSVVVGVISGDVGSDNYTNQLGVFYGLNVAPDDPIVTINTLSGDNVTLDDILCDANVNDIDGGTFDVEVRWNLDGVLNLTVNYSSVSSGAFSAVLDSGNTTKGDDWSCEMRLYDGELYSAWGSSSNITILNSAPVVVLDSPVNDLSTTNRTPAFNWTSSDADGDVVTYDIYLVAEAFPNPTGLCTDNRVEGSSVDFYVPSVDLICLFDNGYYYVWKVRANDGDVYGGWSDSRNISIVSSLILTLTVDDLYFGSLFVGESKNTDDDLSPFKLKNDGTVFVNVSVNASQLWNTQAFDSPYYQFKVDNVSGEEGAFTWMGSVTSWLDMPLSGFVVAVNELNYEDSADEVEVDINITVPVGESPGIKTSMVVFKAELSE